MDSTINDSHLPCVSVVVNVWGGDEPVSLRRSLSSINSQRKSPDEVVVVIDGPISGELEEEIQSFKNKATFLVKVIHIQSPKGLWNARNVGIEEAEHEIVALHDADDVMHPLRLALQLEEVNGMNVDVVVSSVYEFDSKSEQMIGLRSLCNNSDLRKKMQWHNVINHSSVLFRRAAVLDVGGYRNVYLAEDYDLWIRMIQKNKQFFCTPHAVQAFSVDSEMTKRRGGLRFIKSELAIHRTLSEAKDINALQMKVRLMARIVFRITPRFFKNLYRKWWQISKQNKFRSLSDFIESVSV